MDKDNIFICKNLIIKEIGIAKLLLAHCETLATVGSCRHFGGVIGPEVERISAGVAV